MQIWNRADKLKMLIFRGDQESFTKHLWSSLLALREGMLWTVPCLMLSSIVLFVAAIGDFFHSERPVWVELSFTVYSELTAIFPILLTASISSILAMQYRLPRPPVALLSIAYLVVVQELIPDEQVMVMYSVIMAIVTPLYFVPILSWSVKQKWSTLTSLDSAGQIVKESLNMILPAIVVGGCTILINMVFITSLSNIISVDMRLLDYANEPYSFGLVFSFLNSVFWFLGIHGYYALLPMVELLIEAVNLNHSTVISGGEAFYHMNLSFMGSFVFIGGSGATFSLILALLMVAKQPSFKVIALASIPIAAVNVNELLLFGLPIIFNPRLIIPFILVPMMNVVVSLFAIESGWVSSPSVSLPFLSPVFVNAWIATQGDIGAVFLQIFNIFLGTLIYLPFVLGLERSYSRHSIFFTALDTSYTRRQEEAFTLNDDPISTMQSRVRNEANLESHLEIISTKEFCLEYQPQIDANSLEIIGCEALVRAKDKSGNVEYPNRFIPWLEQAGMMKELDLWVVKNVVNDLDQWLRKDVSVEVSINITPQSLMDEQTLQEIERLVTPYAGNIHIEITEQSLLSDQRKITMAMNRLHLMGVQIFIDDFGTGFSSLSYLNKFEIDALKIDRSFVDALNSEKGKKVFNSLLGIASELQLNVVVEGVEKDSQLEAVPLRNGISVQGWYFSKSLSSNEFVRYYQESKMKIRV
ncbi:diguanylate phosphodiesterase [Vibrio sp. vnigr-6D03]|uniref:PTS sugar transporter subunit IIC/EAL domain-containing protein n=1 Tax=Vibrio sp. vnigr-6D03 TaxID=2058088 RepID=UPI000C349F74|nr:EAL domain-containing protein [Vibrio sp. vnigr-6D03]PKF80384.1 diguanylate phosphodiesterase [Vibrio sp. vnigr-6D03]